MLVTEEIYNLIYNQAINDTELLEYYGLTKESKPNKIVDAYISYYFPTAIPQKIAKSMR